MAVRQAIHHFESLNTSLRLKTLLFNQSKSTLSLTRQAHAHILKTSLSSLQTHLLSHYITHNSLSDAHNLLLSLPNPDLYSFSTLIYAYARLHRFTYAVTLFSQMISRSVFPDDRVLPSVIKACAGLSLVNVGKQIHCIVCVSGFGFDSFVLSSVIHMYLKCDCLVDARKVFDKLDQPDVVACSALLSGYAQKGLVKETKELFSEVRRLGVDPNLVSWNGMIAGFNRSGNCLEAVGMFRGMCSEGFLPDGTSVSSVLSAVSDLKILELGIQIHGYLVKLGLGQDGCVISALIDMYGKCRCTREMSMVLREMDDVDTGVVNAVITGLSRNGLVEEALDLFREFKSRGMDMNVVSWTAVIASCSQNGKDMEALDLFRDMQTHGIRPNSLTIPCLLPACGNIAALMHGKAAHCFSLKSGISNDVHVGSALIDMYAKCGRIHVSRLCFNMMPTRNLVCWNALIGGYAMHGKSNEAVEAFDLMCKSGQQPDFVSFTCVLSACSQGGLTDKGWYYFNSMIGEYGIQPRMEHYSCMVTLLGRAGKVEEAYNLIKEMPFDPDACVWGALLSSCRVHNNLDLGEIAGKRLFELEPRNPGNYILLSNIYASKAMWAEVDMVRDMLRDKGLRKNPGCSWIEVKNKVHMLLAGDKSHPQMTQIMEKLTELRIEMKKSGYSPKTDFVLQDVEEQDKEEILCGHSEKLAVVLGLLNSSAGSPIQVIKNLRICGDCHTVIKFISSFERREIFVRDTNRFHHFKDGACSCGDYW